MVAGMTLRRYIESLIARGDASDIGPRRWKAEMLRWLLDDYDREKRELATKVRANPRFPRKAA
jgi:hypothetical protein